jgi:hypothetical protein
MKEFGVAAKVSEVISHLMIELPSAHLADARAALVVMRRITALNLTALKAN